ncbi:hypothetical protein [Actinomadura kijaniata]|uniref:hypothetical protein n=1 Tax=Actinomadura kijaniata TaxID=46161 RepID=UPI000835E5DB|nr:hypothetical protein [Actinomadura kijaniata]
MTLHDENTARRRLAWIGAAVALVLAAVAYRPGTAPGGPLALAPTPLGYRAVPGEDAATAPRRLADAARRAPDRSGSGRYGYRTTVEWYRVESRISGRVRAEGHRLRREAWAAPDGSGREIVAEEGGPRTDERRDPAPVAPEDLRDPEGCLTALREAHERGPVPPSRRASLLRALAGLPGPRHQGRVTDRAGRRGLAVGVDLGPVQVILIFDERDGDLLGTEEVLSGPAALRTSW